MISVLFSPSEGKRIGGENKSMELFGGLERRREILQNYHDILASNDEERIKTLFGLKKFQECTPYLLDIFTAKTRKAVERYSGVAYEYLAYHDKTKTQQSYIDERLLIFSNLFGPILASDLIPLYKVKQGNTIGGIKPENYYKERFGDLLDAFLHDKEVLDLRAGYYEKFYKLKQPYTTLKFLKNGKTVSHWAKAYRGIVVSEMAKNKIDSLEELIKMEIANLTVKEIKQQKLKTEIVYEILE